MRSPGLVTFIPLLGAPSKYPPAEPGALNCEPLKAACQRAANADPVMLAT